MLRDTGLYVIWFFIAFLAIFGLEMLYYYLLYSINFFFNFRRAEAMLKIYSLCIVSIVEMKRSYCRILYLICDEMCCVLAKIPCITLS